MLAVRQFKQLISERRNQMRKQFVVFAHEDELAYNSVVIKPKRGKSNDYAAFDIDWHDRAYSGMQKETNAIVSMLENEDMYFSRTIGEKLISAISSNWCSETVKPISIELGDTGIYVKGYMYQFEPDGKKSYYPRFWIELLQNKSKDELLQLFANYMKEIAQMPNAQEITIKAIGGDANALIDALMAFSDWEYKNLNQKMEEMIPMTVIYWERFESDKYGHSFEFGNWQFGQFPNGIETYVQNNWTTYEEYSKNK